MPSCPWSSSRPMNGLTYFAPVFATSVGFVVIPSKTPHDAASRISSMFAVSRKIFTMVARRRSRTPSLLMNVAWVPSHHEIGLDGDDRTEDDQEGPDPADDRDASRRRLLRKDHDREGGHPDQAHRARDEEDEHEEPA